MSRSECCKLCRYWSHELNYECKRHAPVFDPDLGTHWPTTFPDDWCGDFVLVLPDIQIHKSLWQCVKCGQGVELPATDRSHTCPICGSGMKCIMWEDKDGKHFADIPLKGT